MNENMRETMSKWMLVGLGLGIAGVRAETTSLRLKDGSVLRGEVLVRTDSTLTIRNAVLGEIAVHTRDVVADSGAKPSIAVPVVAASPAPATTSGSEVASPASATDPSNQALFFLPTAFLPPARSFAFRDFELFFMTFGYSPGDRTSLSAGFLFPITPAAQVLTVGLKQNLWSSGNDAALSITGNLTKPLSDLSDDLGLFANSNLVASKRFVGPANETAFGIHGAVGYLGHKEKVSEYDPAAGRDLDSWKWRGDFDFGLGAEAALTPHAKFLIEYVSAAPFNSDDGFNGGLLTVGFRLHGERLAADIAGVRPFLKDDLEQLILWPLLVVSYRI